MKHYKELAPEEEVREKETRGFWGRIKSWLNTSKSVCPRCGPRGELVHMIEGDGPHCKTCDTPVHVPLKPASPWRVIGSIAAAMIALYFLAGYIL